MIYRLFTQSNRFLHLKISVRNLVEVLSFLLIFIFSTRDCLVRFFSLPYTSLSYLLFTIILLFLFLFRKIINLQSFVFLLFFYIFVIFSYVFSGNIQSEYIEEILLKPYAALKLWVFFIVLSLISDAKKWNEKLSLISIAVMILLIITVFTGNYNSSEGSLNYMGVGITGAMWMPLMIQKAFESGNKKIYWIVCSGISSLFIVIYGNRGSLVAVIVYLLYSIIKYTKNKRKPLIILFICVITAIFVNYQDSLLVLITQIINKVGVYSRNFKLLQEGDLSKLTHRDEIWLNTIEAIKNKPILGYGFCYDRVINGDISSYAHNLILELFLTFGIPIGLIFVLFHFYIGIKMMISNVDSDWEKIFTPFWISTTVLLMTNNSFIQNPYFWIPYGILFAFQKNGKKQRN